MTTPTATLTAERCRQHLDRLRPTFRLFQDVLDRYADDQELDAAADPSVGLAVLRLLASELRHDVELLDDFLQQYGRAVPTDHGWDSEGGQI